jgi:hypothetical protein
MSDKPLFQNLDEQERIYAPDQVPENERVIADETSGIVEALLQRLLPKASIRAWSAKKPTCEPATQVSSAPMCATSRPNRSDR